MTQCPICLDEYGTTATVNQPGWTFLVDCPVCGKFRLDRDAYDDLLDPQTGRGKKLGSVSRARIAYKIHQASDAQSNVPNITSELLEPYIKAGCPGPSPQEQVVNAIRYIGDQINQTGQSIRTLGVGFFAIIGSPNPTFAGHLLFELLDLNQVSGIKHNPVSGRPQLMSAGLTLRGWEIYEAERKGKLSGKHGFLALKFGDAVLEKLVRETIKPTLKTELGYDVFDMRDIARAGVIDNIMRAQIRDAAFVLVDLTHDNSGAYWEAGYAEGLNKPVIYICEKSKFEQLQTHFDTNHCTTVVWDSADIDEFRRQLVATLRRSLNLF